MEGKTKKHYIIIPWILFAVACSVIAYLLISHTQNPNTDASKQAQAEQIIAAVGKLMVLPTDEVPTVATVIDPDKLKGQVFFEDAKAGDKVLMYAKAQKAILYDPVLNKIVTFAPLNTSGADSASVPQNVVPNSQ